MRRVLVALILVGCHHADVPPATPAPAPDLAPTPVAKAAPLTTKRLLILHGRDAGWQTATYDGDKLTSVYHQLENGRGPHVELTATLASDGTVRTLDATGHHEMGTPITETFRRDGRDATWRSTEEHGERHDLGGPAMYLPQADNPEIAGLTVRAALAAGGTIALLPGGSATATKLGEAQITAHGETRALSLYALTGIDFIPDFTWMNADGTWFGSVDREFSLVPEGWQDALQPLVDQQLALIRAREEQLQRDNAHQPPAAGLAFTHARVLDVERGVWRADQTVVIVGKTIKAIGKRIKIPAGAEVVDLGGKALIPGLVDMHSHLGDADGVLDIASGVTTARDVGNDPDRLDNYKQRWDAGIAIGPHVFRMGFVEGRNEKAASSKITAETADEAHAAVKFFADRHYDGMKIYNSIRPELIPIITADAHARGMTVTGHIPVHVLANEAVKAGYDGIEHINMLFLNFFATHDTDTRDTTRFSLVGDHAADFDLASPPVTEFLALLKAHHTVIDPTLGAFEDLYASKTGEITHGLENVVSRMPANVQRGFLIGGLPDSATKHELYLRSWAKLFAMVKLIHDRGILEVAGTDSIAGLMLDHELALFVQAGLTPADALRMATIDPARALGNAKTTGSIAPGKVADLVVIDGDPLANIDDVTHVVTTVKAGVTYASAPLFAAVGVQPWNAR